MEHESRAGKWKQVKLFKENWLMLRKGTFLKNHKSTMEHLMSKIQVFNMFKLLLCSSAARASSGETSPAVDEFP